MASDAVVAGSSPVDRILHHLDNKQSEIEREDCSIFSIGHRKRDCTMVQDQSQVSESLRKGIKGY